MLKNQEIENLTTQIKTYDTQLELIQIQHEEFMTVQKNDYEKILAENNQKLEHLTKVWHFLRFLKKFLFKKCLKFRILKKKLII